MKIILICPAFPHPLFSLKSLAFQPLALQILAGLTPEKHEVRIIDENIGQKVNFNEPADLVGITCFTTQAARAIEIATAFRNRGVKVVMGGPHPSSVPEEIRQYCDAVCIGESEYLWGRILEDFEQGKVQPFYKADRLVDMKNISPPRRNLSPQHLYRSYNLVQISRGCPHNCNFCIATKLYGNGFRFREVRDIVAEIKEIKDRSSILNLNRKYFFFPDDNIVANPHFAKELFRALIPLKIKWAADCSINIAKDDELLSLAKQSGCFNLFIGFESVSDQSLQEMNKKNRSYEEYCRAVQKIHDYKIGIYGMFTFGFNGDDPSVFEKTIRFIDETGIECPHFSILTPFPMTEVYEQLNRENRLLHKNWGLYDFRHVVFTPNQMTPQELQMSLYEVLKKASTTRRIWKRIWTTQGSKLVTGALNFLHLTWEYRYLSQIIKGMDQGK